MTGTSTETEPPFWVEDPFPYSTATAIKPMLIEQVLLGSASCFRIVELFILFGILALFAQKYPVAWIFMAVIACLILAMILRSLLAYRRRAENPRARAMRIQRLAQERTGADLMGSALHTAGHPLLKRNQPVVLGLGGDQLSIRSYSNSDPIDVIGVRDIQSVQTIVLDDELMAHTDVVDSTAQAFQLSVSARGTTYTCSFRRMYKVRAIEWYRALEAARLLGGSKSNA
jgi:hypothetical protein